jgi:hypothetical protein
VLEDANLKYYILRDTTYTSKTKISNKWQHVHKFIDQEVEEGDRVILYTKNGTDRVEDYGNDNKKYIYYWDLDSSVWNNTGDAAVLYGLRIGKHLRLMEQIIRRCLLSLYISI